MNYWKCFGAMRPCSFLNTDVLPSVVIARRTACTLYVKGMALVIPSSHFLITKGNHANGWSAFPTFCT